MHDLLVDSLGRGGLGVDLDVSDEAARAGVDSEGSRLPLPQIWTDWHLAAVPLCYLFRSAKRIQVLEIF